jgi:hypothetical protein
VEQKADEVLAQSLVGTPQLMTDLQMLATANQQLSATAAALKTATAALNDFTQAAGIVMSVLGAIALL